MTLNHGGGLLEVYGRRGRRRGLGRRDHAVLQVAQGGLAQELGVDRERLEGTRRMLELLLLKVLLLLLLLEGLVVLWRDDVLDCTVMAGQRLCCGSQIGCRGCSPGRKDIRVLFELIELELGDRARLS